MAKNVITFQYIFKFDNGTERQFVITIDELTLNIIPTQKDEIPEWTNLSFCQCPNCPVDPNYNKHCQVAVNMVDLIEFFYNFVSIEDVETIVNTDERTYVKRASLQSGLSSLMGIIMATSGCPILDRLKPMVRFHLPFASSLDTAYRAMSMYLMAQFFIEKRGGEPDWNLKNLSKLYGEIEIVNKAFARRLKENTKEDASVNALVILHSFASYVKFILDRKLLSEIEVLFEDYT
ncbi:MAG: hypothetical protein LWY06_18845 [Firmicutes bacterium]|nr:hypothetical protein [Bacillota bacterium]